MNISSKQGKAIEEATRNQRKSSLWFDMRAGRITASKFHQACHTDPPSPSISLIKDVCYGSKFSSKATAWGKTDEKHALDRYRQVKPLKIFSAYWKQIFIPPTILQGFYLLSDHFNVLHVYRFNSVLDVLCLKYSNLIKKLFETFASRISS